MSILYGAFHPGTEPGPDIDPRKPRLRLAAQLDPDASRRLLRAVDARRKARGWSRDRLAQLANHQRAQGCEELNRPQLDQWFSKLDRLVPIRLDLDKALALLAAVGVASNRSDALLAELVNEVASLIDEAAETGQVTE